MKSFIAAAAVVAIGAGAAGVTSVQAASIKEQSIATVNVDVQGVAQGFRASKLIGTTIYNDVSDKNDNTNNTTSNNTTSSGKHSKGDAIGKIDDLIVSQNDKVPYAIVDVGSFLGMGGKMVVIPYSVIDIEKNGSSEYLVVPGASKDELKSLPKFEYAK